MEKQPIIPQDILNDANVKFQRTSAILEYKVQQLQQKNCYIQGRLDERNKKGLSEEEIQSILDEPSLGLHEEMFVDSLIDYIKDNVVIQDGWEKHFSTMKSCLSVGECKKSFEAGVNFQKQRSYSREEVEIMLNMFPDDAPNTFIKQDIHHLLTK